MPPAAIETQENLKPVQTIPPEFMPTLGAIRGLPEFSGAAETGTAVNVAEMSGDAECVANAQANLRASKIGDSALSETIRTKRKPMRNVKEGLEWAATGDEDGLGMLDSNIVKEMSEYLFKAGNVSTVKLNTDSQGRILRHGQLMQDVYRNGYQLASAHPVLRARSQAEGNNGARLEHLNQQGLLDTHTMVVFSRTPEGMSDKELDDLNFFSATKSLSIQATGKGPDGLQTETAFVAGAAEDGADRTDKQVVEAIFEYFGVDCRGKTPEELVDMPLLIPNEYMRDGVIDIVKLYDDINGGTFYGQKVDRQDYLEHKRLCARREMNFQSDKLAIRQQLIDENEELITAVDVSRRLAKAVQDRLVRIAIEDESIDTRVFGVESSESILAARTYAANGDHEHAARHIQTALLKATGGSCPSSLESLVKIFGELQQEAETDSAISNSDTLKCVNCPSCGVFHDEVRKAKDGRYHCKSPKCKLH